MKFYIYLIALMIIVSCNHKTMRIEEMDVKMPSLHYVRVDKKNVKEFIPDLCDSFAIEFNGLYDDIDSLPLLALDSLFLDDVLIEKGFTIVNSGGGNWQGGPRFIEVDLTRDSCYCSVYKKYYAKTNSLGLSVSERLICNTHTINAVESSMENRR